MVLLRKGSEHYEGIYGEPWGTGKVSLKRENEWDLIEEGREHCSDQGTAWTRAERMRHVGLVAGKWLRSVSRR